MVMTRRPFQTSSINSPAYETESMCCENNIALGPRPRLPTPIKAPPPIDEPTVVVVQMIAPLSSFL